MKKERISSYERARAYILAKNVGKSPKEAKEIAGFDDGRRVNEIEASKAYKRAEKDLIMALRGVGVDEDYIAKRIKAMIDDKTYALSFGKKVKMSDVSSHVGKGLELLAKVRGDFEAIKIQPVDPVRQLSMAELAQAIEEAKKSGELSTDYLPLLSEG